MLPRLDDTIAAPAAPPGGGHRGIVRISGAVAKSSLDGLFVPADDSAWSQPRRAARHPGHLTLSGIGVQLPVAVWLWPGRRSYTGEPLAEIHTVGSPPLLEAILEDLFARGVRPARAGEFTLRAFLAGRLDLTQAEAVLGVIDADDQRQLDEALRQLAGGVSRLLAPVRSDLLDLLADLEAGLDFVEEDIEFVTRDDLIRRVRRAREALTGLLRQSGERMLSAGRRRVVLAGLPNAGKSTLFNALAGDNAALVSPVPGTTRDWLRAPLEWDGVSLDLIDTAGWEEASLDLGRLTQDLRSEQWDQADLVVWCTSNNLDPNQQELDQRLLDELQARRRPVIVARTKSDLAASHLAPDRGALENPASTRHVHVSARRGSGLDALREEIARRLAAPDGRPGELIGSTAARCRESLSSSGESLRRAEEDALVGAGDELIAIALRDALDHLGRILGAVYTDDILDRIFSRFCIGK